MSILSLGSRYGCVGDFKAGVRVRFAREPEHDAAIESVANDDQLPSLVVFDATDLAHHRELIGVGSKLHDFRHDLRLETYEGSVRCAVLEFCRGNTDWSVGLR